MRLQVSSKVALPDPVPTALLLSVAAEHCPDRVSFGVQVRQAGHVHANQVSARDVCVLPRQEVVRRVLQGALLPDGDIVDPLPGRLLLRRGIVGACAVPGRQVLPAGVRHCRRLRAGNICEGGVKLQVAVRVSFIQF